MRSSSSFWPQSRVSSSTPREDPDSTDRRAGGLACPNCFRRSTSIALLVFAGLLPAPGCRNEPETTIRRVAIVNFENLTSDPELDGFGALLPEIAAETLRGAPDLLAERLPNARDAAGFRATHLLQGYFDGAEGRLTLHLVLEDAGRREMVARERFSAGLEDDLIGAAASVAAMAGSPQREFSGRDPAALRSFGQSLVAPNPEGLREALEDAVRAEPGFCLAAVRLAGILAAGGERDAALELAAAAANSPLADPLSQARARTVLASIDGGEQESAAAVAAYAELVPADSTAAERTALAHLAMKRYAEAARWYRRAHDAEPDRADLLNAAAYPLAYAGESSAALEALERYQAAEPGNPNTYDSLGEIHFRRGDYEAAADFFFRAIETAADFQASAALVKAARAWLFAGNRKRGGELFAEYAAIRRDLTDPAIAMREAQWAYWSGRRAEATEALEALVEGEEGTPVLANLAHGHLAVWALLAGENGQAREHAAKAAAALGPGRTDRVTLITSYLLRLAENPSAWEKLAGQTATRPNDETLRLETLAYAHLFSRRFDEAAGVIEQRIEAAAPFQEEEWKVLLAWTAFESGDTERAAKLLSVNPIIQPGTETPFHSLVFPRILYLRGALAAGEGRRDEAISLLRLFLDYSGDVPHVFGDEGRARQLLDKLGG